MTQEDKELLLKDMCARLTYGVKIEVVENNDFSSIEELDCYYLNRVGNNFYSIKPYLFPLSSMTEEQKEKYCLFQDKIIYNGIRVVNEDIMEYLNWCYKNHLDIMEYLNWCYKNHLDINSLISKGLAIDATGLGIY